jgi:DNA-binding transcriptional ArsR family regulator
VVRGAARTDSDEEAGEDLSPELLQIAAGTFGMLAATVRLHIVWLLAQGERDVGSLADQVGSTVQVVSQHLAKLRLAGLVHARREGRRQVYLVDDPHLVLVVREMVAHLSDSSARPGAARGFGA